MRIPSISHLALALALAGCTKAPTDASPSVSGAPSSAAPKGASTANASPTAAAPGPASSPRATDALATSAGALQVTPIHHGSVLLSHGGKSIYVDPWTEGKLNGLPKADFVFITHEHKDHLDPAAVDLLKKPETIVLGPSSIVEKLPGTVVMKNGEAKTFGGFSVLAVPMYNNKRGPSEGKLYHPKGGGNGYVFRFGDKQIYVSGDTECTDEMRALKDIDAAFVCMNLPYTMPPPEAAECVKAFKPKIVFPYHHRGSDPGEFQKALAGEKGIEVRLRTWY